MRENLDFALRKARSVLFVLKYRHVRQQVLVQPFPVFLNFFSCGPCARAHTHRFRFTYKLYKLCLNNDNILIR